MTTQELVERLAALTSRLEPWSHSKALAAMKAAADRLSEMDAEIKRLREALQGSKALIENMMRHGGFVSVPISSWTSETRSEAKQLWCVPTWHLGDAEAVVRDARAALEQQQKGAEQ